ncbi:unnamed protein product [Fraxinus pennsylvanica]|uniref:Smr domain-containing protein n=1 Tax=Fraxinus pennsylvanica TaxID=56036 RepID=A0AAD1ZPC1_9LAMI|nr:unnamed protein product [Fraxinus pennsylvanica]
MYSEMREEARDHARLCNAYFEQARQGYLIGNKALAKELIVKGQLHNMQMKAAHGRKAQESIYRQRNLEMQANGREKVIDLQWLHLSEAIQVLKHELAVMKNDARSTDQRLLLYICGHHTSGMQANGREKVIDLQWLHLIEAIQVLKHELAVMKNDARSTDQRLLLYICGHHTRGSHIPFRLPAAVQHYLLEEEGLDYTEPQPGRL